jgi:hypothetical protein
MKFFYERDCRTSLSLTKNSPVGKYKKGEELLRIYEIFHSSFNRNAALQRKGTEITMFLLIAIGQFSLLSYWLIAGIWAFPRGFPILFKNCPEAFQ